MAHQLPQHRWVVGGEIVLRAPLTLRPKRRRLGLWTQRQIPTQKFDRRRRSKYILAAGGRISI
jgi:hypothetical protein